MISNFYIISIIVTVVCISTWGAENDKIKIACIGNSITFGYDAAWNESYPYRLQELFGTEEYIIQNDGVNAITLLKNGDNPYYKNGKLPDVFAFQPDIITIKLGTNDTKPFNWDMHHQEFKSDYLWLIDTLAGMASAPDIWLVLPVPVFNHPTAENWGIRDSIVKKIIPLIEEVATERGLPVIDMYTPLEQFPEYFSVDGVHPNAAGLDTIAHVLYRALKEETRTTLPMVSGRSIETSPYRTHTTGINFIDIKGVSTNRAALDLAGRKLLPGHLNTTRRVPAFRWHVVP